MNFLAFSRVTRYFGKAFNLFTATRTDFLMRSETTCKPNTQRAASTTYLYMRRYKIKPVPHGNFVKTALHKEACTESGITGPTLPTNSWTILLHSLISHFEDVPAYKPPIESKAI